MDPKASLKPTPGRCVAWGSVFLALAIILTGCNDTQKQRALTISASKDFQSLYNDGACQQIYDGASPYFQSHETGSRWLRDCAEVQERFGSWLEFTPSSNNSWPIGGVGIVWVRGTARFENSVAEVRLDWHLENDHAALSNILIEHGGEAISIPGFTGEVRY
jgi:hypothetical protein